MVLIKPAVQALASTGLSFGAERALKKIFGNGYGTNEIKLYKLVQAMSPHQKQAVEDFLVGKGWSTEAEQNNTEDFSKC